MSRKSRSTSSSSGSLACPTCARRYGLDERFCQHCGMPLVYAGPATAEAPRSAAHETARKIRPELTRGELVRVAVGTNQAEAEMIQSLLLDEGVPSLLQRSAGVDVPEMLAGGRRDVMVPASGAEAARTTLRQAAVETTGSSPAAPLGPLALRILAGLIAGLLFLWLLVQLAT